MNPFTKIWFWLLILSIIGFILSFIFFETLGQTTSGSISTPIWVWIIFVISFVFFVAAIILYCIDVSAYYHYIEIAEACGYLQQPPPKKTIECPKPECIKPSIIDCPTSKCNKMFVPESREPECVKKPIDITVVDVIGDTSALPQPAPKFIPVMESIPYNEVTRLNSNENTPPYIKILPLNNTENIPINPIINAPINPIINGPINNIANVPVNNIANVPINNIPNVPINNIPNVPINNIPNIPINNMPNAPINNIPNVPINNFENVPINNIPNVPINNFANVPINNFAMPTRINVSPLQLFPADRLEPLQSLSPID